MTSLASHLVNHVVLPLHGAKRTLSDTERARRSFAKNALRPARYAPPPWIGRDVHLAVHHNQQWPIYQITPKHTQPGRTVLYWHGGSYIREIMPLHWWFLAGLAKQAQARILTPIYPLGAAAGAQPSGSHGDVDRTAHNHPTRPQPQQRSWATPAADSP